jgi:glyoxylase-like metal-dependent hydrolase (beta-lactamase superfamily II)
MITEIQPDLYRIEIPLPRSPLKALNSYVIRGEERSLIIDTGMDHEKCLQSMLMSLQKINVPLAKADFFITHLHADHLGLVGNLATKTSRILISNVEALIANLIIREPEKLLQTVSEVLCSHGFPPEELKKAIDDHPGYRYIPKAPLDFCGLNEDDTVEAGGYSFRCIETPGHSPCHLCLYEEEKKILVSGDHILFDITPNITWWPQQKNSLKNYLSSLEKIAGLDVKLVLPGHRRLSPGHSKRVREIQEHHRHRLDEVLSALERGARTAWEVAPSITWNIRVRSWEIFPPPQKWFALGETIAHLDYLEQDGRIVKARVNGSITYSLK